MSKLESRKRTNAIFLLIVLVLGTFAAISPSFMIGVHAHQYGKDRYDDKESYGKENSYYKSKDSSNVNVKKIECNNINTNPNGFNGLELGTLPTALNGLASDEAQVSDEGEIGTSSFESGSDGSEVGRPSGSDSDSRVVCIYNNDLTKQTSSDAKDTKLIVTKVVTCETTDNHFASFQACFDILGGPGNVNAIHPNHFDITVSGKNSNPSQFEGSSFPVVVTLDPGNYQLSETADPSVSLILPIIEDLYGVNIDQSVIFSGDCNKVSGEGTIAEGESQICTIQNAFTTTVVGE